MEGAKGRERDRIGEDKKRMTGGLGEGDGEREGGREGGRENGSE